MVSCCIEINIHYSREKKGLCKNYDISLVGFKTSLYHESLQANINLHDCTISGFYNLF